LRFKIDNSLNFLNLKRIYALFSVRSLEGRNNARVKVWWKAPPKTRSHLLRRQYQINFPHYNQKTTLLKLLFSKLPGAKLLTFPKVRARECFRGLPLNEKWLLR